MAKWPGCPPTNFSDNSQGESPFTEEMLHCLGIRQLITGRGMEDCTHWPGKENLMGNIPLRSFQESFPKGTDNQFLAHFTNCFPLPTPFMPDSQPGSWKLVTPPSRIISAVILLLQKTPDMSEDLTATIGNSGYAILRLVTRTLQGESHCLEQSELFMAFAGSLWQGKLHRGRPPSALVIETTSVTQITVFFICKWSK
jgi:hypothetical protein